MRRDRVLLIDMLVAARDAVSFLEGCNFSKIGCDSLP
jgi:hypothetical protein